MRNFLSLFVLIVFVSCNSGLKKENESLKSQVAKLESENKILNDELTVFKMDPSVLISRAEKFYTDKNMDALKGALINFELYHPTSEFKKKVSEMIYNLEDEKKKEAAEREKIKEQEKQKRLAAVSKLKRHYDDVSGTTWYKNPYFTHYTNTNLTSLYIGQKGSTVWLRLMMSYRGEDWIFFDNAYLSYGGNTKEIVYDKYNDKETEVGNGGVWEWIDISLEDADIDFLRNMAESTDCKMRLSGKYSKTRNLSTNERKGITDVLLAYDVLKNGN